jgi:hypothetical protein
VTTSFVPLKEVVEHATYGSDLIAGLSEFIDRARILARLIDRIAFASDASLYRLIPRVVVQPINSSEMRRYLSQPVRPNRN